MQKLISIIVVLVFSFQPVWLQEGDLLKNLSIEKTPEGIEELREFLNIPNDALNIKDIEKNIDWLRKAFQDRGFSYEILQTSNTPIFLAERRFTGADKTVLFYMHFDGQGVDPPKWDQESPYKAELKKRSANDYESISWDQIDGLIDSELRVFARSSSDDKGPIIMFLNAVDLIDQHFKGHSSINLKVILDGEEEKGSTQLPAAVIKYHEKLQADYMIINDGPIHSSGRPTVVFGGRGLAEVNITVYGPRTAQHSGHYGNYAPNPAFRLSKLLAGMKDDKGRVILPGYYDGIILDENTQNILLSVPDDPNVIHKTIGIAEPEKVGRFYQEALQYPSLNVRGMQSGWVGKQVRTIVPDRAEAAIDIRLVPESNPDRLVRIVKKYILEQGYYVIDREPNEKERLKYSKICKFEYEGARLPFRTQVDSDLGVWLKEVLQSGTGKEPVQVRIMGGTVPIAPFVKALKIPAVIVPLVNNDNNQHGPNENLQVWNFTNGIHIFLAIMR